MKKLLDSPGSLSILITRSKTNHKPITAQIFVHVTLLRGSGNKFNMADERETISEWSRSSYIALSSSEVHVCITGKWKENNLRIVLLSRSYFQKL